MYRSRLKRILKRKEIERRLRILKMRLVGKAKNKEEKVQTYIFGWERAHRRREIDDVVREAIYALEDDYPDDRLIFAVNKIDYYGEPMTHKEIDDYIRHLRDYWNEIPSDIVWGFTGAGGSTYGEYLFFEKK